MRDFRVYVFSLPRSGSSMMCGVLERLGVKMVYTSEEENEREKREEGQRKRYGDVYRMNPSFYEITRDQWASWMKIMETPYSGCKVIIPQNGLLWQAVCHKPAKVILMKRDPEEVRQSQEASYARARAQVDNYNPSAVRAYFRTVYAETETMLDDAVDWITVNYEDARERPAETVHRVAEFIQSPLPIEEAVKSIEPNRARFKRELLVENAV